MSDIHSCGYWCSRAECIKAQRDELRDKIIGPATELARAYNATAADFDGCEADCEQAKEDAEHAVIEAALAAFGTR